ncbi:hypothetical protein K458DRAFT_277262, partial [Lentithecium fluviatile CBS 122367]
GGSQLNMCLTTEVKSLMQGILVSDLPQTFRDSIKVCGWLNVRNIWIDSTCIIQDSAPDWEKESKQMHRIYADALLNIAASEAPNGNARLFTSRDPDLSSKSITKFNHPRGNIVLIPEPDVLAATVIDGPLAKRGWTSLYAVWDTSCMEYSRRLLTRQSDKEIVLSGIAEYFKSLLSEDYIIGLWKGDIILGLFWFTETSGDPQTLNDIAPSWSW